MTLRNHTSRIPIRINFVPWMNAFTSTPYHDFTWSHHLRIIQYNQRIFWTNCVHLWCDRIHSWYGGVDAICLSDLTEYKKWLWPVKVTFEVIMRRLMVIRWSYDEGPLKWNKKISRASNLPVRIEWVSSRSPPPPPTKWPVITFKFAPAGNFCPGF